MTFKTLPAEIPIDAQAAFQGYLILADMLAELDRRPTPDHAMAETLFHDIHFNFEKARRTPAGAEHDALVWAALERFYDVILHLRLDTLGNGLVKDLVDKWYAPTGRKFPDKAHRKLLTAARKRRIG